jgi:hypothetical protein
MAGGKLALPLAARRLAATNYESTNVIRDVNVTAANRRTLKENAPCNQLSGHVVHMRGGTSVSRYPSTYIGQKFRNFL